LVVASFFGGFQMFMPFVGWAVGLNFQGLISGAGHWVAFGLLAFIGAKMIYDSTRKEPHNKTGFLRVPALLALSVATSIDALVVGLSFAFLQTSILLPVLFIGGVTFLFSFSGFAFGHTIGQVFESKIKIVGGLMLIAIGVRILFNAFF
jgi:manganese efflux pump family protein